MKHEYKSNFKDKIIEISKKFDMSELLFHSFIYQFDQNTEMSASDCVYLINAVLDYPFDDFGDIEIEDDDYDSKNNLSPLYVSRNPYEENNNNTDNNTNNDIESIQERKYDNMLKRFWLAYAFLSLKKLNMTNSLIDLAIKFQIALANTTSTMIDKKSITTTANFRYAIINSNLTEETKYFHYANNLERLCIILMETFKHTRSKKIENKPFLLAMFNGDNKTYYVEGNLGCNREYDEQKNNFGFKFKYDAKKKNIKIYYEFNTDEIITIQKDELFQFIQEISDL